jgi:hypothetical protein
MTAVKSEPSAKPSLLSRLQAWWDGEEVQTAAPPAAAAPAPKAEPEKGPSEATGWTDRRFAATQRVFGPGCVLPGGEATIRELLKPLDLKKDMRIVDFGARAGCLVRLAASELGVGGARRAQDPRRV